MPEVSVFHPRATADAIARVQLPSGLVPHIPGGMADPWNHVEAVMALDVAGLHAHAARGYEWLASTQRRDGAWAAGYRDRRVIDRTLDANFTAYVAAGAWHHYVATADAGFLESMWPVVRRAISFVLDLQTQGGTVLWARDSAYRPWPGALITSSSCICFSLECAIAIGEELGGQRPDWELSLTSLADAIVNRPHAFEPKDRFSMDWYYPVLGGAVTGIGALDRLSERWDEFVVPGHGVRCVSDRPWVTTGETSELILALDRAGRSAEAVELFEWLQQLRDEDGAYWMGATFPDSIMWPRQKPTWGSGSVLLAADALARDSATSGFFRGETFPASMQPRVSDAL